MYIHSHNTEDESSICCMRRRNKVDDDVERKRVAGCGAFFFTEVVAGTGMVGCDESRNGESLTLSEPHDEDDEEHKVERVSDGSEEEEEEHVSSGESSSFSLRRQFSCGSREEEKAVVPTGKKEEEVNGMDALLEWRKNDKNCSRIHIKAKRPRCAAARAGEAHKGEGLLPFFHPFSVFSS